MKKWKQLTALILTMILIFSLTGCEEKQAEAPVRITLWHVYGAQTDSPLNDLIDRFNQTVGKEQNIYVQVTAVSNTNTIHESVLAAACRDPGAPELPDLFISYPKTILALPDEEILVDYRDYFTDEELSHFIPDFIEEGTIHDRLTVLPVAKSTEILFLNQTAFDRYASATGADRNDLRTWEGLYAMAEDYADWTDAATPDIPGDGKAFFVHDYHFNYFQVGVESLGDPFFLDDEINYGPAFDMAFEPYARAAVKGGVWLQGGYATEPLRTGDAIISAASSASVLYYTNKVTYPDNTQEEITLTAMPCPVFENGEKLVMQRGAGFCTVKSTPEREQAAITFLKWLTEPETNVEFVTSLGYMPVTKEAFTDYLPEAIDGLREQKYQELYRVFLETQKDYRFYTPPQMESYLELETTFEYEARLGLSSARKKFLENPDGLTEDDLMEELIQETGDRIRKKIQ